MFPLLLHIYLADESIHVDFQKSPLSCLFIAHWTKGFSYLSAPILAFQKQVMNFDQSEMP